MTLALFDFDGTITTHDSLSLFFKYVKPGIGFYINKYIYTFPQLLSYKFGIINSDKLKLARVSVFLKGLPKSYLLNKATEFNKVILPQILKNSAMDRIEWHRNQKHVILIVSASVDLILEKFCTDNSLHLITNQLCYVDDKCSGFFKEADCNGEQKVARILKEFNLNEYDTIYAYGDTKGDRPMLNLAKYSYYRHFN